MPAENLTRAEATKRSELLSVKSYLVSLDLTTGADFFKAQTTVRFSAAPGTSSFIDLIANRVLRVVLNGSELDPGEVFRDSRVQLPNLAAENVLEIDSEQVYMNTGEGLHRFVDPADGEVYLYSQFEVPDARRMFAVFEQPDMKATFEFVVKAPARWKVVSVQPTPEPLPAGEVNGEPVAVWSFAPTPVMSSYITALIAGPYHEVRSELTNADGRIIPLGVFCRASLAPYLDHDYIFEKTRQGFDFFAREFNYPYPFEKYDQLFVPEYNAGAMENIGAVTYTEAYVFRSKVTDAMRERRVVTILHELAHMWFGDLVTMKWWNDLWLNESFAEFMSVLATAEATEWKESWSTFVASEKTWAYRQDQLPSTHPIVAEIKDLDDVLVNFDGITYAKGASVLKQLVAFVGREPFMQGVHNYFVKHAYKNTELKDLLVELEATSGRDLSTWSKLWLETAGVNTLKAVYETDSAGNFTEFSVQQSAITSYPTLRPHRIVIGLYSDTDGTITRVQRLEVDIDGAETIVSELIGTKRPDLIILNDEDLSYAKLRLDDHSYKTAVTRLREIDDSLARALIWGTLWDATRDAELASETFIDVVLQNIDIESNSTMMRTLLGQLTTAAEKFTKPEARKVTLTRVADALWQLAKKAPAGSDAQFQFVSNFAALIQTPDQAEIIDQILEEKITLEGLDIDTDLGWQLLIALAAVGSADEELIAEALKNDQTASGEQSAAHARAVIPSSDAKEAIWSQMVETPGASNLMIRHSAIGFMRAQDPEVLRPYIARFFAVLNDVWATRSFAIAEEIIEGFYPHLLAGPELLEATKNWLAANTDQPQALRRMIIEAEADVIRAINAQNFV